MKKSKKQLIKENDELQLLIQEQQKHIDRLKDTNDTYFKKIMKYMKYFDKYQELKRHLILLIPKL